MRTLQDILRDIDFSQLPFSWQGTDLASFSPSKSLRDYQQEALRFALKALWKYYQDCKDYQPSESDDANEDRKQSLWNWYVQNGLKESLDISLRGQQSDVRSLLCSFYPCPEGSDVIPYYHFINRISFWMATGSGKSLVLVKLIEQLHALIAQGEIPTCDVLVLTARDDLLEQLEAHVKEFNSRMSGLRIVLQSLKSYPEVKGSFLPTLSQDEITVFTYRSDNLGDEQKERILDFRNYESGGRWYVLLDEAHKGDREESKRQHIYSILSRNGFLFNFSATFTDARDKLTTAYNFNLSEFVRAGYSKHIAVLRQENCAFSSREDYTDAEKQRIVLKMLLTLACVHRAWQDSRIQTKCAYHRPLGLVLVHSVNTEDADLKRFFQELERIGQGEPSVWDQACRELDQEFAQGVSWVFEGECFRPDWSVGSLTYRDLLRSVYNADEPGKIEVLIRPSNRHELAFKLKSAAKPFALIKIGDISEWLKSKLQGYEIVEGYVNESLFAELNAEDSPINLLMGSRSFYEGWDSNRPNVIAYINIGTGIRARKFILQSIGRGVRIAPLPGRRRRLLSLYNARDVDQQTFDALKEQAPTLETLFIFGTNRSALETVINELDQQRQQEGEHSIPLEVNKERIAGRLLLVPTYSEAGQAIAQMREPRKFEVAPGELRELRQYVAALDDRVLASRHRLDVGSVQLLRDYLSQPQAYFNTASGRRFGRMDLLLSHVLTYFRLHPLEFKELKTLEDEIRHFRHIRVFIKDISGLQQKIDNVNSAPQRLAEVKAKYEQGQLTLDEFVEQVR